MDSVSENLDEITELARKIGKAIFKLKKELGLEESPKQKPFVIKPGQIKARSVTFSQEKNAIRSIAKAYGISIKDKTDEEILKEITLKLNEVVTNLYRHKNEADQEG